MCVIKFEITFVFEVDRPSRKTRPAFFRCRGLCPAVQHSSNPQTAGTYPGAWTMRNSWKRSIQSVVHLLRKNSKIPFVVRLSATVKAVCRRLLLCPWLSGSSAGRSGKWKEKPDRPGLWKTTVLQTV